MPDKYGWINIAREGLPVLCGGRVDATSEECLIVYRPYPHNEPARYEMAEKAQLRRYVIYDDFEDGIEEFEGKRVGLRWEYPVLDDCDTLDLDQVMWWQPMPPLPPPPEELGQ